MRHVIGSLLYVVAFAVAAAAVCLIWFGSSIMPPLIWLPLLMFAAGLFGVVAALGYGLRSAQWGKPTSSTSAEKPE